MAPATVRRAPYKDFLQPTLHRRFSSAATLILCLAYLLALLLGKWNSFLWSWFPIGPAGVRTGILFLCGLVVIVLRISQYHLGSRASKSPFLGLLSNICTIQALDTFLLYNVSSFLFCVVYRWWAPSEAKLNWVTVLSGDRARLNERPVFLSYYFVVLAVVQALVHMAQDDDQLQIDASKVRKAPAKQGAESPGSLKILAAKLPALAIASTIRALSVWVIASLTYWLFFRRAAWGWAMSFFRLVYNLPKSNFLPASSEWCSLSLLARCFWAGSLLSIVWAVANEGFSTFMVKEPLKNGNPLTSESKDPNGSLLNGLKSKKLNIKSFALWELAFIARDYEPRRRAIFEDIDRKDGPMWSQVSVLCLDVLRAMEKRIDDYGKPPPPPSAAEPQPRATVETKPRSSSLKEDPIFQTRPSQSSVRGEIEKTLGQVVRAPGHSPISQLSPLAKKTLRNARDRVLTKEQQAALASPQIMGRVQSWALLVIRSEYIGWIFRQDFRRRFAAAVLGEPYAEASHHINAVNVLSLLAVHSLTEDKFGNVHRDVATIVRTFTTAIQKLQAFKTTFPTHWTDVDHSRKTPEVDALLQALRTGLAEVLAEFEPFSRELRLSRTDIRLAKEASEDPAAERPQEMAQVGK